MTGAVHITLMAPGHGDPGYATNNRDQTGWLVRCGLDDFRMVPWEQGCAMLRTLVKAGMIGQDEAEDAITAGLQHLAKARDRLRQIAVAADQDAQRADTILGRGPRRLHL